MDMQGRGIVLIWILVLRALAAVPSPLWPRCAVWLSCFGEDLLECMLGRFPTSNFQIPGGSGHLTGKLLLNVKLHVLQVFGVLDVAMSFRYIGVGGERRLLACRNR